MSIDHRCHQRHFQWYMSNIKMQNHSSLSSPVGESIVVVALQGKITILNSKLGNKSPNGPCSIAVCRGILLWYSLRRPAAILAAAPGVHPHSDTSYAYNTPLIKLYAKNICSILIFTGLGLGLASEQFEK